MLLDYNQGSPRSSSMTFYKSSAWRQVRQQVLVRDMWSDLGVPGVVISKKLLVHHINPIQERDLIEYTEKLLNLDNLITVSVETHNILHYGQKKEDPYVDRQQGDTILW